MYCGMVVAEKPFVDRARQRLLDRRYATNLLTSNHVLSTYESLPVDEIWSATRTAFDNRDRRGGRFLVSYVACSPSASIHFRPASTVTATAVGPTSLASRRGLAPQVDGAAPEAVVSPPTNEASSKGLDLLPSRSLQGMVRLM